MSAPQPAAHEAIQRAAWSRLWKHLLAPPTPEELAELETAGASAIVVRRG